MKQPTLHALTNAPEMTMTRARILALTALLAVSAAPLFAQTAAVSVAPASRIVIAGGSNVHDWSCQGSTLQAAIELDSGALAKPMNDVARPIRKAAITIPVKSLRCGKAKMDENMYKALNAEKYPDITYVLSSYEIDTNLTTRDAFTATTVGELTVAGTTTTIEMPVSAIRGQDGTIVGEGKLQMKMTDVGIKPPVALLGALRTKNEIAISFRVLLDKATLLAATNQTNKTNKTN
jgi:polyisoprenoid-binding protein YceI